MGKFILTPNNFGNFTQQVLGVLRMGGTVTALQCSSWVTSRSTKLTSRISDLRADGWDISDRWEKTSEGKRYKVYYMTAKARKGKVK